MTAEQYLFLNSVCLTLQCERKNKETVNEIFTKTIYVNNFN